MKVIHIIPSAFDYFDDIRAAAFSIVEKMDLFSIDAEAFTLQYSSGVSKRLQQAVRTAAPSKTFQGMSTVSDMFDDLSTADIVHVHTPLFGGMGPFFTWRREHPDIPVVITYYRPCVLSNALSYFIYLYNWYYLSRLTHTATACVFQPLAPRVLPLPGVQFLEFDTSETIGEQNLTEIFNGVQLRIEDRIAAKYAVLYTNILST